MQGSLISTYQVGHIFHTLSIEFAFLYVGSFIDVIIHWIGNESLVLYGNDQAFGGRFQITSLKPYPRCCIILKAMFILFKLSMHSDFQKVFFPHLLSSLLKLFPAYNFVCIYILHAILLQDLFTSYQIVSKRSPFHSLYKGQHKLVPFIYCLFTFFFGYCCVPRSFLNFLILLSSVDISSLVRLKRDALYLTTGNRSDYLDYS